MMGNGGLLLIQYTGVISSWFWIHRTMSHSFGDISIILDLWGCSWGLSRFPSSKSRFLSCLIGNMELLCTQCNGIGPHFSLTGKSHVFSSSCIGNLGYIFELRRGWQFKTRVCSATSGHRSSYDRYLRNLDYAWQENTDASRSEA